MHEKQRKKSNERYTIWMKEMRKQDAGGRVTEKVIGK